MKTLVLLIGMITVIAGCSRAVAADQPGPKVRINHLRAAIADLIETHGDRYPNGPDYLRRLDELQSARSRNGLGIVQAYQSLQREALLANPLLDELRLLVVRRKFAPRRRTARGREPDYKYYSRLGMPTNHECNSSLPRLDWNNEIAVLDASRPDGSLHTLYRPKDGGYVGELELHFDAKRLMFTRSDATNWNIWEVRTDGTGLRQVSQLPAEVDCMDPLYLPDKRVVFSSTACYQSVPCWHGQRLVTNLYSMSADGTHVRRLCYDQDHNFHPTLLESGQVVYHRWDYTGINHVFLRQLMVMNPDGTGQRAVYGSNSWYPNALYFARPLPGIADRLVAILSGYHGPHRMGQLVVIDMSVGWHGEDGLVQRISGRGQKIDPQVRDDLIGNDWPKFLHPYPLSAKYFLVSAQLRPNSPWGVYLADTFDNLVLLKSEPGWALLEPTPLRPRRRPPVIADRIDLSRDDAVVFVGDVYAGRGLAGVPRGVVKRMRVIAYDYGYPGLAGPNKVGFGGPWEVMRILGTVAVEPDGSAMFRIPANTPITLQPLDTEGKAVQWMRSWYTAMPGESVSCVGCHETPRETVSPMQYGAALGRRPDEIEPWYGPPRGFDFAREVQPVLDRYCVTCHDGRKDAKPDLRGLEYRPDYKGRRISDLGVKRLDPNILKQTGGVLKYTPSYEALIGYIRRVGIEDDVSLLTPGEYHADTSELIQMLRKGHGGIHLDPESWDRLITWIDLNAPCHGTWSEVWPIPNNGRALRARLRKLTGGPATDPESVPKTNVLAHVETLKTSPPARTDAKPARPVVAEWPFDADAAAKRQAATQPRTRTIDLGNGTILTMVHIPAGTFVMGSLDGEPDERPMSAVTIDRPFWMGAVEITNRQYKCFDPEHDSHYYAKRHMREDDKGIPLDAPDQPVVRVSWQQAMAFCQWLSKRTGQRFSLPTEAQWEWAARAGSASALWFGTTDSDPTPYANLAGREFARGMIKNGLQVTGGVQHLVMDGAWLASRHFDDGAIVTEPVGSRAPNPWGLYDMAGNAAEWTRSAEAPYPYRAADGRNATRLAGRKIVRGGSFFDRPKRARSGFRLAYPYWQRVFNVGFRVVCESEEGT